MAWFLDSLQLLDLPANFGSVRIHWRCDNVTPFEMYLSLSGFLYDCFTCSRLAVICSDVFTLEDKEAFLLKAEVQTFLFPDP